MKQLIKLKTVRFLENELLIFAELKKHKVKVDQFFRDAIKFQLF